jgi:hypothetical protein
MLETWLVVAIIVLLTALIVLLQCYSQTRGAENVRSWMLEMRHMIPCESLPGTNLNFACMRPGWNTEGCR